MIINIIDKNRFKISEGRVIFYNELTNRSFGELIHNNYSFKIGWNSQLIDLKTIQIAPDIYALGIDQDFAIIDFNKGEILLKLELFYTFYDIKLHNQEIYICTELEVLVLNKLNYNILKKIGLLEFFEDLSFEGNTIIIKCIDNVTIKSKI